MTTARPHQKLAEALGDLVIVMQMFELLFVIFAKGMIPSELDPDGEIGFSSNHFKNASKNVLKELRTKIEIKPEYDEQLSEFLDKRHIAIHRGLQTFGDSFDTYHSFVEGLLPQAALHTSILLDLCKRWAESQGATFDLPPLFDDTINQIYRRFPAYTEVYRRKSATE